MLRPAARFIIGLVLGLALLTWAASLAVYRTIRDWFEKDISLRGELAVNGARQSLLAHWGAGDAGDLHVLLTELTRDERILAAAACSKDLSLLASGGDFAEEFNCRTVGAHVCQSIESSTAWLPMRTFASESNVYRWAGRMLVDAARLRDRERLTGRIAHAEAF